MNDEIKILISSLNRIEPKTLKNDALKNYAEKLEEIAIECKEGNKEIPAQILLFLENGSYKLINYLKVNPILDLTITKGISGVILVFANISTLLNKCEILNQCQKIILNYPHSYYLNSRTNISFGTGNAGIFLTFLYMLVETKDDAVFNILEKYFSTISYKIEDLILGCNENRYDPDTIESITLTFNLLYRITGNHIYKLILEKIKKKNLSFSL